MDKKNYSFSATDAVAVKSTSCQAQNLPESQKGLGGRSASSIAGLSVLISDEHYKHTLGIVRHLGRMGARVNIVASSINSLACRSKYCDKIIPAAAADLEILVQTMLRAMRGEHFDLIIPVSYPMTLALARRAEDIVQYTNLELPESEAVEMAANKLKMTSLAAKVGVPAPRTYPATEVRAHAGELNFPVVIKPQNESPGRCPIRYAQNVAELEKMLPEAVAHENSREPAYLVQEFIPGQGCGFFATYQHGVCKRIFMHRRVREYPATGGASSCAESFYDAKLETYGRRMLDALDWHGVAMVEFRHDSRDGEFKLMEINPKFWGSLDLALAAGADFPGDLCHMALGRKLSFSDQYERDLRFQWPLSGHGDLFHLWTRPQSLFDVARDFLNPHVKSNLEWDDAAPNIAELYALARKLFRKKD
jgi:predicted ATP-grasp superfamily ATP-dependent carboligase